MKDDIYVFHWDTNAPVYHAPKQGKCFEKMK